MKLRIDNLYLTAELDNRDVRVAKLSKAFGETLERLKEKGYVPRYAEVRFIVAWKGENDKGETPILLVEIYLSK